MLSNLRFLPGRLLAVLNGVLGRALFALPAPLLRRLAGRPPEHAHGLHPEAWLLAKLSVASREDLTRDDVPIPEQRRRLELTARRVGLHPAVEPQVSDRQVPGPGGPIPVRLYVPDGVASPSPLLVYFHGGGWVQGSVESHDGSCRMLADLASVRVLSVDYRLAPEHPYPAAVEDAVAAYRWAVEHAAELGADPARIAVGGDSAGGNLAAVVCQVARDEGEVPLPAFQLLLYPATDAYEKSASVKTFAEGFYLTEHNMDWFMDRYVPDRERRAEPRVSPLRATDLSGLPPAHVVTCLPDPLRDEGEAYAQRLREAGVHVSVHRHAQLHGFFNTTAMRSSREALATIAGALRAGLGAG